MNRTLEVCSVGWLLASALWFAQHNGWKGRIERAANYREAVGLLSRRGRDRSWG